MKKQVIFNVGGALSSYIEIDGRKIVVDLGKSSDFCPVLDFLLPLAKKRGFTTNNEGKYKINQLFLSHLDNDHISSIDSFEELFSSEYYTVPCDNSYQNDDFIVNIDRINNPDDRYRDSVLAIMRSLPPGAERGDPEGPERPLVSRYNDLFHLYHIPPKFCETDDSLDLGNYANNISLVLFGKINGHSILMPGDMMPDGMEYLLEREPEFRDNLLRYWVDFLVAPHHWLSSSFSTKLFQSMHWGKTKRLNIISEKVRRVNSKENRTQVDARYSSANFSGWKNNLWQLSTKTSWGHIVINYQPEAPAVTVCQDNESLVRQFL